MMKISSQYFELIMPIGKIQGNVATQVAPSCGKIFNWCKWLHLVAKFATYASGAMLLPNLVLVTESISGSVVPLAMFLAHIWCVFFMGKVFVSDIFSDKRDNFGNQMTLVRSQGYSFTQHQGLHLSELERGHLWNSSNNGLLHRGGLQLWNISRVSEIASSSQYSEDLTSGPAITYGTRKWSWLSLSIYFSLSQTDCPAISVDIWNKQIKIKMEISWVGQPTILPKIAEVDLRLLKITQIQPGKHTRICQGLGPKHLGAFCLKSSWGQLSNSVNLHPKLKCKSLEKDHFYSKT